jgi:diaminopimelate epimerase
MKINFIKMVASGNDFVVIDHRLNPACRQAGTTDQRLKKLARCLCDRKFGIGADGLLVLEKTKQANVRMRIFNADGSEAQMCGNGARCVALYCSFQLSALSSQQKIRIETKAGIIESQVRADNVKIKLTEPRNLRLGIPLKINGRLIKANFINTGVPHVVIFTEGLEKIDVVILGRQIRYHQKFLPAGTNADFVEVLNNNSIKVRTYERGVEDETLACGTGSVASALLTTYLAYRQAGNLRLTTNKISVHTQSGEILKVYFNRAGNNFKNVWLEGKAKIVYKGVYDV